MDEQLHLETIAHRRVNPMKVLVYDGVGRCLPGPLPKVNQMEVDDIDTNPMLTRSIGQRCVILKGLLHEYLIAE
ncbi:hypothetical protein [Pseudomonas viridiflava]